LVIADLLVAGTLPADAQVALLQKKGIKDTLLILSLRNLFNCFEFVIVFEIYARKQLTFV